MADDDDNLGVYSIHGDNPTAPDMKGASYAAQDADKNPGGVLGTLGITKPKETDVDEGFQRFQRAQGYAKGGRPKPGKAALVGEKGPEAFVPDRIKVKPHHRKPPGPRAPKAPPFPGQTDFDADDEKAMRAGQRAQNAAPPVSDNDEDDFGGM